MPHVSDGPYVPFRAFGSSIYHMYVTLLERSRRTHTRLPMPLELVLQRPGFSETFDQLHST